MLSRFFVLGTLLCTLGVQAAVVLPFNSVWRFKRGNSEASLPDTTAWREPAFNDTGFTDAPAPFWYGDVRTGGTQLTDMQNSYTCIFLRKAVMVTDAAEADVLKMDYFADDGFVMWINDVEVWRERVPGGDPTISTLAANQPSDPAPLATANLTGVGAYLVEGVNWVTVQHFNTSLGSSDLGFDCSLETLSSESDPPTIVGIDPPPGTLAELTEITVTFSEGVQGVNADDLLLNTQPASSVSGSGTTYTFQFTQPLYGAVAISWFGSHGITDLALAPNAFDAQAPGATWLYDLVDTIPPVVSSLFPPAGATIVTLGQVEVRFSEEVTGVEAGDLLINNVAATSVSRIPGGPYIFQFAPVVSGAAMLQWVNGHGITDQAAQPNAFAGGMWSYTVDPNAPPPDLIITEIMAANVSGLRDEDGQEQDWIEIHNRGGSAIDLATWSLSDDPAIPSLWAFSSRLLGPGEYLVVFASGKDRRTPTGGNKFHANFQLSRSGEFVGLYSPDSPRRLVSAFNPRFPEQRNDHSYGYDTAGELRYFAAPTPGVANGNSTIVAVCDPVHFSVQRGHFTQPFSLVLSTATPGGTIRYTLDGSEPVASSPIYLQPLQITSTALVRATVFKTNFLPAIANSHSYFFNQSAATRSLPVLSILTSSTNLYGRTGIMGMEGGSRSGDGAYIINNPATDYHNPTQHGIAWERPVSAELILPGDNSGWQVDCGIRVQGSDWQRPRTTLQSKFSWRLYFRSDYGVGRLRERLFPLTTVEDFDVVVVRAGFNEAGNPFIRDEITRRLSHDMGQVASVGTFWNVFTNGVLAGFYNPCERVHEEFLQAHLGGGSEWDIVGPSFAESAEGPGIIDGDRNEFNSFMNYIWTTLSSSTITDPTVYTEVGRRLDLVNFVDYCLLNAFVAMGDWPANNWRAGRERSPDGIWRFIVWDAEWAFGIYSLSINRDSFAFSGTGTEDAGLNSTVNSEIARIYQRLRPNPEFRLLWADRIHKHFFNNGALTSGSISNRFNEMRSQLSGVIPGMDTEILVWARDRHPIVMPQFNTYGLYGFSNNLYGVFASSNAPAFSQHGGRVPPGFSLNMTSPQGGTIYYTTDGTDPRVPFTGAVSASATAYFSPVALAQSGLVKARTLLNGTHWSALNEASFDVGTRGIPLRITEIMYDPVGGSLYEFIELQNVGGSPLDLSGMVFDEGIGFNFNTGTHLQPGARLVLANSTDPNAFAIRYPGVTVFGYFDGNLSNAGERISLRDSAAELILTVDYDNGGGWPRQAAGPGSSLEIINPLGDPDDPANWMASPTLGGSPGAASTPSPLAEVRINEVMALNLGAVVNGGTFPDYVEIFNAGAGPVDLVGWSLSDSGDPRKFVFPSNTIVPGSGHLVVWCDSATNTTPGLHTGFALDVDGDHVFLYDPATNRIDAVSFGLQLGDYSIGRVGGGEWRLTNPTAGGANVAATVAPVGSLSINEWLANPLPGQPDWVELHNQATLPVGLAGCYLATTSTVHHITSLSFVGPKGFVQLFANEGVSPASLDLKLPAVGGSIVLYDPLGALIDQVSYSNAQEGISRGRLPDGAATIVNFPGSMSPGAANFQNNYSGAVLNELLARNRSAVTNNGRVADFVELFNSSASDFVLTGMSLSLNRVQPGQWLFPVGAVVPANGYLVVWCDDGRAASALPGDYNSGRALDGESGGAYLFNAAGQLVNSIDYGFQVPDLPIGLSGGQWRLLSSATPGAANAGVAPLGPAASLRINEWMAKPASGPDWFELYNLADLPVMLSGLYLTDDASSVGATKHQAAPLSFIAARGFVRWIADNDPQQGRDHLPFQLDGSGDLLRVYSGSTLIDSIVFGDQQLGVSEGRLLDGSANIVPFPGSPTPAQSNHLPIDNVWINEILTHADDPFEDAIELHNPSVLSVNVSGWFLSNSRANPKRYRIPDNTVLAPGGFAVFYQGQFGNNGADSFTLSSAHGDEVLLSEADGAGNLTGRQAHAEFGAAANGVSFGRVVTAVGVDYAPLSALSFGVNSPGSVSQFRTGTGAVNAAPRIGPVIISEIMYQPLSGTAAEEFIELRNISGSTVNLYDPAVPANRWRLRGGIAFTFLANETLAAGAYALVVPFDPGNPSAVAAFRSRYAVPAAVQLFGPYTGQLGNGGDKVELVRPDTPQPPGNPDAGFVPSIVVDTVSYRDELPWPVGGVEGGGLSLQRRSSSSYGNDPLNWLASAPTAGGSNGAGVVPPPVITQNPQSLTTPEDSTPVFIVSNSGQGPFSYQWRRDGIHVPGATSSTLAIPYAQVNNAGAYDVVVANAGGTAVSAPAALVVTVTLVVLIPPEPLTVEVNDQATFMVTARGTPPLAYQWRKNRIPILGQNSAVLTLNGVDGSDDAEYDVVVSDVSGSVASLPAKLTVLIAPGVAVPPLSQTNYVGGTIVLSIETTGTLPMGYRWRKGGGTLTNLVLNSHVSFLVLENLQLSDTASYSVVLTNEAFFAPGILSTIARVTVRAAVDSDNDGLPNDYEIENGLNPNSAADAAQDTDGDGFSNTEEFIAGTDPQDPLSFLQVSGITTAGHVTVSFIAVLAKTYTVQYRDEDGPWQILGGVAAGSSTRMVSVLDLAPPQPGHRVYRLVTPGIPLSGSP